jgi:hypothetical protein
MNAGTTTRPKTSAVRLRSLAGDATERAATEGKSARRGDSFARVDTVGEAGRGAAWLARQSGGLEVPSSNLGAPIPAERSLTPAVG